MRFITFLIIIGIVPLLFFGLISLISTRGVLIHEAIKSQEENIMQGTLYIDLVMEDVESLIANLSGIDELNKALNSKPSESSYDKLLTQAKLGYILSGYISLKGLVSIDLFIQNGAHYHVGETLSASNINNNLVEKLFSETDKSEGAVYWSGIEENINLDSEYSNVITAAKTLKAKNSADKSENMKGLLVISYDPAVFDKGFRSANDNGGYSIILDAKNRIVYHPNIQFIGKTISDDISTQIEEREKGFFTQIIDGENMLTVFDRTQKGNWKIAKLIPQASILSKITLMSIAFIALLACSILAIVFVGMIAFRQIVQLNKITDTFRLLQSGDFKNVKKLTISNENEIGELGKLFNSFIDAREDITTQKKLERRLNQQNQELYETLESLKKTQIQMIQQEKMAGIGQLAAGVAHEINNPLGFVTANFDILNKYFCRLDLVLDLADSIRHVETAQLSKLQKKLDQAWRDHSMDITRSDLQEIVSDTNEGLSRIAEIVNALKAFSRNSQLEEKNSYDINEGIKTTLLIANNEIKYDSTVKFNPKSVPKIDANGGQINQVLLNIIVNAAQAIKCKQQSEKGIITINTYAEHEFICCEIQDNGCGMTEDVMKRVFEPFFTTKPVGQGTGMGLGLAYDIITNKHCGKLEVQSQPDVGTCFKVSLPINQKATGDEYES